ncbi:MAG: hypothetical protein IEMM0008_1197 [bacterium]|nr:MAG: hypothetical protein IEMM0008_1197 [bacterium]
MDKGKIDLDKVKTDAKRSCEKNGHFMGDWADYGWSYISSCRKCGYQVTVNGIPGPKIDLISGRAIHRPCKR